MNFDYFSDWPSKLAVVYYSSSLHLRHRAQPSPTNMGKKRVGKNRRRHAREDAIATAILDAKAAAGEQERALGMVVDTAPNEALFTIDRARIDKKAMEQDMRAKQKEASKAKSSVVFRGETPAENTTKVKPVVANIPGQKKAPPHGTLEKRLLERKTFKKRKQPARTAMFTRDLWTESAPKSEGRQRVEKACNKAVRAAKVVLTPNDGDSVNPAFEAHQDALGEAVAGILQKTAEKEEARRQMAVDFSKLPAEKDDEGDVTMDADAEEKEDEEQELVKKTRPERKSRVERNRERRRKHEVSNRERKIAKKRHNEDYKRIDQIAQIAAEEADKLNREKVNDNDNDNDADAPLMRNVAKERVRTERNVAAVPLSEDLDSQLRNVAMSSSCTALTERYFSLERRGMVEPPSVRRREARQAENERRAALLRDKPRKNRRGSRSKISYWRQGGKKK